MQDEEGNIAGLLDGSGTIVNEYSCWPFGGAKTGSDQSYLPALIGW